MTDPAYPVVPPNGIVGILGGGQLGRLLALAAARLGLRTHVFAPDDPCPAGYVSSERTIAAFTDKDALKRFAEATDVVTYEFENVPVETVAILERCGAKISPGAAALRTAQDRLVEKQFIESLGATAARYFAVDDLASLEQGLQHVGRPAILKTRRLGYDGKGQTRIAEAKGDLAIAWEDAKRKAWEEIGAQPSILEGVVDFEAEISVIGARHADGSVALYDPPKNTHRDGILRRSVVPAPVALKTCEEARRITAMILTALDYVGVIGVEFFVLKDGALVVNEFAPRVHNSGHWTSDACAVSQFEQHMRAVCGWPLGDPARHSDAVMENLIGAEADKWRDLARERGLCVHLYGKSPALAGRKMGHVTKLGPRS